MPAPPAQPPPPVVPSWGDLAIKRSVARCAVAVVLSFGVYTFWWFHQYRKRISAEVGKHDDAVLHTLGLFVPFLNVYVIYLLWKDISDARLRVGLPDFPAAAYAVGAFFLAPLFYALVNAQLNEYWDRRTGGSATEAPWTTGEKLSVVVPLVLFIGFIVLLAIVGAALRQS